MRRVTRDRWDHQVRQDVMVCPECQEYPGRRVLRVIRVCRWLAHRDRRVTPVSGDRKAIEVVWAIEVIPDCPDRLVIRARRVTREFPDSQVFRERLAPRVNRVPQALQDIREHPEDPEWMALRDCRD